MELIVWKWWEVKKEMEEEIRQSEKLAHIFTCNWTEEAGFGGYCNDCGIFRRQSWITYRAFQVEKWEESKIISIEAIKIVDGQAKILVGIELGSLVKEGLKLEI